MVAKFEFPVSRNRKLETRNSSLEYAAATPYNSLLLSALPALAAKLNVGGNRDGARHTLSLLAAPTVCEYGTRDIRR